MSNSKHLIPNLATDLLRTFIAVVAENSCLAAVESVRRTQAAVSQQMQDLEQIISSAFFVPRT